MVRSLLRIFVNLLPTKIAYAHCDVPCGIYDPKPAQIAAATVLKMVEKIQALPQANADDKNSVNNYYNSLVRYVFTKEEHAGKCKEEILILWTDYFKPEHLGKFPNLHDKFWETAKLCSVNKQEVSLQHAKELVQAVAEIAEIFQKSKETSQK